MLITNQLKVQIVIDFILGIIFQPLFNFLKSNFKIEKFFINFNFLSIKPNNPFYKYLNSFRGKEYNLCGITLKNQKHHIITTWSILHVLYYIFRGIITPNLYYYNLINSVLFEIYEYKSKCHDVMDVFINMSSYYIGSKISKYYIELKRHTDNNYLFLNVFMLCLQLKL